MMFDKDLFLLLCEKYDVELSEINDAPVIKNGLIVHEITDEDVVRAFEFHQPYFEYFGNRINTETMMCEFSLLEDYAEAC